VVSFQDNPDAAAQVRADPTLLPAAIEEVLGMRTPFPRLGRITKVDTEVGGVHIPGGQIVLPWLAAYVLVGDRVTVLGTTRRDRVLGTHKHQDLDVLGCVGASQLSTRASIR